MTDPADKNGRGEISAEERAEFHRRISELDAKLDKVQVAPKRASPGPPMSKADEAEQRRAMGEAWRIGLELVVGVFVGLFIGWQADKWLGTAPWLLLVGLALGFAGGLLNVIRLARQIQPKSLPGKAVPDDEDE